MNPPSEHFPDSTHAEQGTPEKEARGGVKADDAGGIRASDEHVLESPPACPFQSGVYVRARACIYVDIRSRAGEDGQFENLISQANTSSSLGPRQ